MKGFVGVMDNDWFAFLSQQPGIDGVDFWSRAERACLEQWSQESLSSLTLRRRCRLISGKRTLLDLQGRNP
jgi:hypothetical protein